MLFSIALILLIGMFAGWLCKKLYLPSLLGMILTGILLGPYALNMIDSSILNISSELRRIALIIILTRAGLSLDIESLKKVGRPAVLMCFVPACFEMLGMVLLAPRLLEISVLDAAIMGAVIAAVSPAVIVPKMLKLMENGYGEEKGIPQLILAGAAVDDVFVIVIFSVFTGLAQGASITPMSFVKIPVSIISGIVVGATVDISYVKTAGLAAVILIFGVLVFRMVGVFICLLGTKLSMKERVFCMIAYTPKATVQAAIGGIPLSMGLACGNLVLAVAVLAILITAPLGAFMIDCTYKRLLTKGW